MIDNRIVGKRIAKLRQKHRLTQQQLAAMLRVSHQAVSKWESGQTLPDIQTMLELTRFFGLTVEQLVAGEDEEEENKAEEQPDGESEPQIVDEPVQKEVKCMTIQQLLQMAPFMSKDAVEEIAMNLEEKITASQLARLAPFLKAECLDALLEKHQPEFSWETLRRIAPFMSKDAVDKMARSIAAGEETLRSSADQFNDNLNKTINDIGRAFDGIGKDLGKTFDDIGKGLEKAAKKTVRFGKKLYNEVANAIDDFSADVPAPVPEKVRPERILSIRKKAFERAMQDEKWDWLGQHIGEIDADSDLKARIAARARELGMNDWICRFLGGFADEFTVDAAIAAGDWDWLGENAWQMTLPLQEKVARSAADQEKWQWLEGHSDLLDLRECALEIALAAWKAGEKNLTVQLAKANLEETQTAELANVVYGSDDFDTLDQLIENCDAAFVDAMLRDLAEKQSWHHVQRYINFAAADTLEALMEAAVEQGNFDAVDMLDELL